jgi:hypothetical protein
MSFVTNIQFSVIEIANLLYQYCKYGSKLHGFGTFGERESLLLKFR